MKFLLCSNSSQQRFATAVVTNLRKFLQRKCLKFGQMADQIDFWPLWKYVIFIDEKCIQGVEQWNSYCAATAVNSLSGDSCCCKFAEVFATEGLKFRADGRAKPFLATLFFVMKMHTRSDKVPTVQQQLSAASRYSWCCYLISKSRSFSTELRRSYIDCTLIFVPWSSKRFGSIFRISNPLKRSFGPSIIWFS